MPIDLLKNRDFTAPLSSFDGKVGALVTIGKDEYFITTNADYIPALPTIELYHSITLQSDCRYGKDDPMVWPQQYCPQYCHLAFFAKKGARPDLEIMWWDPTPDDFIVVSSVTPGLGRVHPKYIDRFLLCINNIVDRVRCLQRQSKEPLPAMFGQLSQHVVRLVERIQTLPAVFLKTVFAVTTLQRACLELDAMYEYWTVYKAKMDDFLGPHRFSLAPTPTHLQLATAARGLGTPRASSPASSSQHPPRTSLPPSSSSAADPRHITAEQCTPILRFHG
ncbi:hypothetical protein C8F01DRAFT_1261169 [Mycena amicta]|nr:hypothetical protein C8F01DRAFT_1261169 [Mycena amicta]